MATSNDFIVKSGLVVKANTTIPDTVNFITTTINRSVARPSLDLNFADSLTLDPRVSFSRNSIATYFDEDGLLKYADINKPRFDYNPVTGQSLGLLIEESRTNSYTYSSAFSNWNKSAGINTIIDNAGISPTGLQDASLVTANGTTNSYIALSPSITSGTTYTKSIYAKAVTTNVLVFEQYDNNGAGGTAYFGTNFDLSAGTITSNSSGNISSITALPNGWYRCVVTRTYSLNTTPGTFYIGAYGSGVGSVYLWGAQLEVGAFASSLIPTTSAGVNRPADRCLLPAGPWYNPTNSTWFAEFQGGKESTQGTYSRVLSPSGSTTLISTDGGSTFNAGTWSGDSNTVINSGQDFWTTTGKVAITYNNTTLTRSLAARGLVSSGSYASSGAQNYIISTAMGIGQNAGNTTNMLNGHISRITYWPTNMTTAQMQILTT